MYGVVLLVLPGKSTFPSQFPIKIVALGIELEANNG